MNEKDKIIVNDVLDVAVSAVPGLSIAWGLSKAVYGAGLKLRQQKALEWVEMVRDNPVIFTEQILGQAEFQDAFVYTLEKYIRERNEQKREAIKRIFLGYTSASDPVLFELERLVNMTSVISVEAIEFLKLLHKEILPTRNRIIEKEGRCFDRLSSFVQKYIDEEYDPNSKKVRDRHGYDGKNSEILDHIYNLKEEQEHPIRNAEAELLGMGVLQPIVEGGGTIGGGGSTLEYEITKFGEELLIFIN